ncbi:MAG: NTP transferase domain-containing protein [Betaproteobacteria bacterium]|nr:NTP transferase domain-containing protein [Betaproteobacteria bacterium]
MATVALVQARLGSRRLPMKGLLCLRGMPLIDWVVRRVAKSELLDRIVVAIADTPLDEVLVAHVRERLMPLDKRIAVFCGPENDVLERFRAAGAAFGAKRVVRVCADNPLVWGGEIDNLIRFFEKAGCDYAYNHIPRNNHYPDGLGAEMLSFALLHALASRVTDPKHREHCLSYIWENAQHFAIRTFDPPDPKLWHPELKLDVDSPEDFRRLALMPLHIDMLPVEIVTLCNAAL